MESLMEIFLLLLRLLLLLVLLSLVVLVGLASRLIFLRFVADDFLLAGDVFRIPGDNRSRS